RAQPLLGEAAGAPHRRAAAVEVERIDPELLGADEQRPLERLAAEQLQDRVLGRRLPLRELREAEVTERLQRELIDPGRRDEVALAGVEAALLAEGDERVDDHAEIERVVDPQHRALVRERT